MTFKNNRAIAIYLFVFIAGVFIMSMITSCGKQSAAGVTGLNIQYEVLNLSPDLNAVNLFIDFQKVNTNPYIFSVNRGYFYVPSIDTPYQFRTYATSGLTLFSRDDVVKPGLKYSLFITGALGDNSLFELFTVDTASAPGIGRGKLRFVNVSPTGTSGLDVFANGTQAFSRVVYKKVSNYIELPAGNYDLQINNTGSSTVLKDLPAVTIQDGRLYTLYAYGYTSRADSAAFNAAMITNK